MNGPLFDFLTRDLKRRKTVSGPQFHQTGYGRKFFEADLPRLIEALETIGENLSSGPEASLLEWHEVFNAADDLMPLWDREDVADDWTKEFVRLRDALETVRKSFSAK